MSQNSWQLVGFVLQYRQFKESQERASVNKDRPKRIFSIFTFVESYHPTQLPVTTSWKGKLNKTNSKHWTFFNFWTDC